MRERIVELIIETVKGLDDELDNVDLSALTEKTRLYGSNGILDSLALVTLTVDLEEKISDVFGKEVVLASENAMSKARSPFRSINRLAEYVSQLIEKAN